MEDVPMFPLCSCDVHSSHTHFIMWHNHSTKGINVMEWAYGASGLSEVTHPT